MTGIDVAIIIAFLVYAISSGIRSSGEASKNLEEYFLAGRSLAGWKAGVSMAATQFAADTPLLVTGLIATAGVFSLWRLWSYAVAFLALGFIFGAAWRRAGVLTDAELTELRYSDKPAAALRGIKAVYLGIVFNCTVLAMVLLAAMRIAEPFLLWHEWLPEGLHAFATGVVEWVGVPLTTRTEDIWIYSANNMMSVFSIVLVTTFYSTTGGLRSVVRTDIAQFFLMMIGTLWFCLVAVDKAGGFAALPHKLEQLYEMGRLAALGNISPDNILAFVPSQAKDVTLPLIMLFSVQWLIQINADGTGYLAQRTMACKSDRDAKTAAIIFTVVQILVRSLMWVPLGVALLIIFAPDPSMPAELVKAEREMTYVRGIAELLPRGVMGLMLTGMLAALASTVDTHLNWGSSYITNDLYNRFLVKNFSWAKGGPRTLVWVARCSNLFIVALAMFIMMHLDSIQEAWAASLLLGAGVGLVIVLRWLWWGMTAKGELAALIASFVCAPLLLFLIPDDQEAVRLLIIACVATTAAVITSRFGGYEPMETLKAFYQRAKPMGYWGPVQKHLGEAESTRGFSHALLATALCSVAVFTALIAIGTLMVGAPPPTWLPIRWLWVLLMIAVSAASGYWGVRHGFRHQNSS